MTLVSSGFGIDLEATEFNREAIDFDLDADDVYRETIDQFWKRFGFHRFWHHLIVVFFMILSPKRLPMKSKGQEWSSKKAKFLDSLSAINI